MVVVGVDTGVTAAAVAAEVLFVLGVSEDMILVELELELELVSEE